MRQLLPTHQPGAGKNSFAQRIATTLDRIYAAAFHAHRRQGFHVLALLSEQRDAVIYLFHKLTKPGRWAPSPRHRATVVDLL
ncbi:MAG: hypothetical protein ACYCOU_02675 [Sulfobacillus sp.]